MNVPATRVFMEIAQTKWLATGVHVRRDSQTQTVLQVHTCICDFSLYNEKVVCIHYLVEILKRQFPL